MNEDILRKLLVAALMQKHGTQVPGVPPPPPVDPSLQPTTEAQRALMRKGLASK
jgi:hypothetical protein